MVSNTPQARSCCTALFELKLQNTRQAMRGHNGKETEQERGRETTPSCTEVQALYAWELKSRGQAQARGQRLAAPEPSQFCARSHPHLDYLLLFASLHSGHPPKLIPASSAEPRQCIKKQRHHFVNKGPYSQSYGFSSSHVWIRVGPQRRLSTKELMLSNCGATEDS